MILCHMWRCELFALGPSSYQQTLLPCLCLIALDRPLFYKYFYFVVVIFWWFGFFFLNPVASLSSRVSCCKDLWFLMLDVFQHYRVLLYLLEVRFFYQLPLIFPGKNCYFAINPSLVFSRIVSAQMLCNLTQCLISLRKPAILFLSLASYPNHPIFSFPSCPPFFLYWEQRMFITSLVTGLKKDLLQDRVAFLLLLVLPLADCVLHYSVV